MPANCLNWSLFQTHLPSRLHFLMQFRSLSHFFPFALRSLQFWQVISILSATSLCATSQKTNEFICFLHSLHQYFCFSCGQNLWPPHVLHLLLSNLKPKPSWFTNSFTDQTAMARSMATMHVVDGRRLLSMVPTAAAQIAASFLRSSNVPAPIPPIAASFLRSPIVPAPISPIAASFLRSPIVPAPIPPIELINIPSQSPNRPRTHPFFSNGFRLQPTLLAAPEPALAAAMPRICHERSFFATARTPPKLLPFNSPPKPRDRLRLTKKLDVADELSLRQLVPQDVLPRTCESAVQTSPLLLQTCDAAVQTSFQEPSETPLTLQNLRDEMRALLVGLGF